MLRVPLPLAIETFDESVPPIIVERALHSLAPLWDNPANLAVCVTTSLSPHHNKGSHTWELPITLLVEEERQVHRLASYDAIAQRDDDSILHALCAFQFALARWRRGLESIWKEHRTFLILDTVEVVFMPHAIGMRTPKPLTSAREAVQAYLPYAKATSHDADLLAACTHRAQAAINHPMTGVLVVPPTLTPDEHHRAVRRWERVVFGPDRPPFPFSLYPHKV